MTIVLHAGSWLLSGGTAVPGPHQDGADFWGPFLAVVVIFLAIMVVRRAFRRPPRPPHVREPPPSEPPAADGEQAGTDPATPPGPGTKPDARRPPPRSS